MPDRPLFLERASYRRRRLGDAARVLPVLAFLAVMLPVWWMPRTVSYAGGAVWLFSLWGALILAIWMLHRALLRAEAATLRASEAVAHAAYAGSLSGAGAGAASGTGAPPDDRPAGPEPVPDPPSDTLPDLPPAGAEKEGRDAL